MKKHFITSSQYLQSITELKPLYDTQKSFYRKAFVKHFCYQDGDGFEDVYVLQSYDSDIIALKYDGCGYCGTFAKLWNGYSVTTMKHINEFLRQYGALETSETLTKKEWLSLENKAELSAHAKRCIELLEEYTDAIFTEDLFGWKFETPEETLYFDNADSLELFAEQNWYELKAVMEKTA